jgi:hypothetical protein
MDEQILEAIRSFVAEKVAEGFDDAERIIEYATEFLDDEHQRDDLGPHVERITAKLFEDHRRAQAEWVGPTDCDRLDGAFAALDRAGIVARQHFTCCSTCGHYEIGDEIAEASQDHEVTGYVFYHMQDTESARACGQLYLAYGSVEGTEERTTEVGRRIVQALQDAGLKTEWDGSPRTRVAVTGLDWKRRRP